DASPNSLDGCEIFFQDARTQQVEKARSDRDGHATVAWSFAASEAPAEMIVRYRGNPPRQRGAQARSHVYLWSAETPILLVDLDYSLAEADAAKLWTTNNLDLRTATGAAAALRSVRPNYRILYWTAEGDRPSRYNKLHAWLERSWVSVNEQFP